MHQIACRLIFKGLDDAFIAQATSRPKMEIKELRTTYLTFSEAMIELGLSEQSLRRYIRRGLIVIDGKIPRYVIGLMKDPVFCFLMQWEHQEKKLKNQTEAEHLEDIKESIREFEEDYGGHFEELYGHLSDEEIDLLDGDIKVWKDLVEELRKFEQE